LPRRSPALTEIRVGQAFRLLACGVSSWLSPTVVKSSPPAGRTTFSFSGGKKSAAASKLQLVITPFVGTV
jgi:hypothetical protein